MLLRDELRFANDRVSDCVGMQLMRLYLCKGRNVTTDSYFSSLKLANQLKEKQRSLLGTMKKIRREMAFTFEKDERRASFLQGV